MPPTLRACNGKHVRVGVLKSVFLKFDVLRNNSLDNFEGLEYNVLEGLATFLNFSYDILDKTGDHYGHLLGNNTWTGLVGRVHKKEVDVAFGHLTVTSDRMGGVDFTPAYFVDSITLFISTQNLDYFDGNFFKKPFSNYVWLILGAAIALYSSILTISEISRSPSNLMNKTIWSLTFVFSQIIFQSFDFKKSRLNIARPIVFLIMIWSVSSTILIIFYGCTLTASTSMINPFAINTFEQLIPYFEDGYMELGVHDGSSYMNFIMEGVLGKYDNDLLRQAVRPFNDESYMKLLVQGKLAFVSGTKIFALEMYERRLANDYHVLKEILFDENLGIAMNKQFSCKRSFNRVLYLMRETGLLNKWEENQLRNYKLTKMIESTDNAENFISFRDFKELWVLLLGLFVCLPILLFEYCSIIVCSRVIRKRQRKCLPLFKKINLS